MQNQVLNNCVFMLSFKTQRATFLFLGGTITIIELLIQNGFLNICSRFILFFKFISCTNLTFMHIFFPWGRLMLLIPKFYIEKLKEIMWRIIWNPAPHSARVKTHYCVSFPPHQQESRLIASLVCILPTSLARVKTHSLISVYPSHLTSKSQDSQPHQCVSFPPHQQESRLIASLVYTLLISLSKNSLSQQ